MIQSPLIPAQAGIQAEGASAAATLWILAFAGMNGG